MNNRRKTLKNIIHKYGGYAKVPVWIRISKNTHTKAYQVIGIPTKLINLEYKCAKAEISSSDRADRELFYRRLMESLSRS